jgi:hypothetical protein
MANLSAEISGGLKSQLRIFAFYEDSVLITKARNDENTKEKKNFVLSRFRLTSLPC